MVNRQVLPSVLEYISELSTATVNLSTLISIDNSLQSDLIKSIQENAAALKKLIMQLEEKAVEIKSIDGLKECARKYRDIILPLFEEIRKICDFLETLIPEKNGHFQLMPI